MVDPIIIGAIGVSIFILTAILLKGFKWLTTFELSPFEKDLIKAIDTCKVERSEVQYRGPKYVYIWNKNKLTYIDNIVLNGIDIESDLTSYGLYKIRQAIRERNQKHISEVSRGIV